ncbi:MAG: hypothetical protein IT229_08570, partial [Flavobacteriales bacterium]|nr:hypothetical protein [Flavobacteriales bacterium]
MGHVQMSLAVAVAVAISLPSIGAEKGPATPFIQNKGQWAQPFLFKAEVGNMALFVEPNGLTWS